MMRSARLIAAPITLALALLLTGCGSQSSTAPSEEPAVTAEDSREAHGLLRYPRICVSVIGDTDGDVLFAPAFFSEGALGYRSAGQEPLCFAGTQSDTGIVFELPAGLRKQVDVHNLLFLPPQFGLCDPRKSYETRGLCSGDKSWDFSQGDERSFALTDADGTNWTLKAKRLADTEWIEFTVTLEAV